MTLLPLFLLVILSSPSVVPTPASAAVNPYVVYFGAHTPTHEGLSQHELDRVTESHYDFLGSFLGSREDARDAIFYSYTRHINGFSATIDDEVADRISGHPDVVSIFLDKGKKLHTTRSWEFLGLEHRGAVSSESAWEKARYGEDTIIGNLDTG